MTGRLLDIPVEILLQIMLKLDDFHDIIIMCHSNVFLKKIYYKHKKYLFSKLYNINGTIPDCSMFFYISRYEDRALSTMYLKNDIKSVPRHIIVDYILSDDHFYRYCSMKDIYKIVKKVKMKSTTLTKIINHYKKKDDKSIISKLRAVKLLNSVMGMTRLRLYVS